MVSREEWLRQWSIPAEKADQAWLLKQELDARHNVSAIVQSDYIDPVLSHADGKMYDSKAALFRSYRADGNPQGVRYECVGERVAEPYKRAPRDKAKAREAVTRTLEKMGL